MLVQVRELWAQFVRGVYSRRTFQRRDTNALAVLVPEVRTSLCLEQSWTYIRISVDCIARPVYRRARTDVPSSELPEPRVSVVVGSGVWCRRFRRRVLSNISTTNSANEFICRRIG